MSKWDIYLHTTTFRDAYPLPMRFQHRIQEAITKKRICGRAFLEDDYGEVYIDNTMKSLWGRMNGAVKAVTSVSVHELIHLCVPDEEEERVMKAEEVTVNTKEDTQLAAQMRVRNGRQRI